MESRLKDCRDKLIAAHILKEEAQAALHRAEQYLKCIQSACDEQGLVCVLTQKERALIHEAYLETLNRTF